MRVTSIDRRSPSGHERDETTTITLTHDEAQHVAMALAAYDATASRVGASSRTPLNKQTGSAAAALADKIANSINSTVWTAAFVWGERFASAMVDRQPQAHVILPGAPVPWGTSRVQFQNIPRENTGGTDSGIDDGDY